MFGYLKEENGHVAIANRIFEMVLLNMFMAKEAIISEVYEKDGSDRIGFIKNNKLDMDLYTCDIWKNGSKHLYFYTLHNQEHAVDLIQNSIKLIRAIDYINISKNDYYVLFIACYLHDIFMVTFPDLDKIQAGTFEGNKIYSDFVKGIQEELKCSKLAERPVKSMLKEYY